MYTYHDNVEEKGVELTKTSELQDQNELDRDIVLRSWAF